MPTTTNHPKKNKPTSRTRHSKKSFASVMAQATHGMPRYRRIFSRIIHTSGVASLSDLIGSTIMRPNAILAGAICSFGFTLATYLLAKNFGYGLSGFEPIGAFIIGWTAGIIFDLLAALVKRK